jgi:hypothetical protein
MVTKKKAGAGTGRTVGARAAAQENGWNGATRFQAISPVFGKILELQQAVATTYAPAAEAFSLSAAADREIREAVSSAAKNSGATEDQIRSWVESFNSLGKAGLMSSIPLTAEECCANMNGTFELLSRYSGGVEVPARGRIYGDMNPKRGTGTQLITMWTEENLFPKGKGEGAIFLVMLAELKFTQNGPYEVLGSSRARIYGNQPGYEKGLETTDEFLLVRKGHNESMVGVPSRSEANGSDTAARFLVEVSGDPGIIKYKMWGVPATDKTPATLDTVDTYAIMSSRRPLVGGWESITDYFNRITGSRGGAQTAKGALFSTPGNRQALRRACEHVPAPLNSRRD